MLNLEKVREIKDGLDSWNNDLFWDNLGTILTRCILGQASPEERAIVATSFLVIQYGCTGGIEWQLPSTREVLTWEDTGEAVRLQYQSIGDANREFILDPEWLKEMQGLTKSDFHYLVELVLQETA